MNGKNFDSDSKNTKSVYLFPRKIDIGQPRVIYHNVTHKLRRLLGS
ncbi:hypothetical protein LEP1GSC128_2352 [Leptospira borgpetersenii str. 200801926]|uniref:Uncharacterized protein n=2 Tax=Leptospira borgpetersenii TaxID=174 RepID=M3GLF4_LEPBO|nr:hypothetical protein LEP1GSC128_2352 [Leptospira borgpetersenii str. 200801926]EMG01822.1 hypothetical protein LEP1GSC123_0213 [Leptospira borgpetersenii str. 200701203]EMK11251.1 hypothetical protein LEP1GSC066_3148 [Leptospira sp. serovar Kenya str. Sh9]